MSMHSRPMYGACILLLLLSSHDRGQTEAATCDSRDVTDPTSRRDSAGWIRENLGANEMRQGHVSAGVVAWDKDILLAYGGTHIRTDDVTDVLGRTSNVSVLMDDGGTDSWTELEMIGLSVRQPEVGQMVVIFAARLLS